MAVHGFLGTLGTYAALATLAAVLLCRVFKLGANRLQQPPAACTARLKSNMSIYRMLTSNCSLQLTANQLRCHHTFHFAAGPFDQDLPPWPLFKFGIWAVRCLDAYRDALLPPHVRAVEIGFSYVRPQACPCRGKPDCRTS